MEIVVLSDCVLAAERSIAVEVVVGVAAAVVEVVVETRIVNSANQKTCCWTKRR